MSMIAWTTWRITCDHPGCREIVEGTSLDEDAARATFRAMGWTWSALLDLCPEHRRPPRKVKDITALAAAERDRDNCAEGHRMADDRIARLLEGAKALAERLTCAERERDAALARAEVAENNSTAYREDLMRVLGERRQSRG